MSTAISAPVFRRIIVTIFLLIMFADNAASQPRRMKDKYLIDNKSVSKKEFERFLAKLKQVPGTWFCAETNNGGVTGYDAKDDKGVLYSYKSESTQAGVLNTLALKKN